MLCVQSVLSTSSHPPFINYIKLLGCPALRNKESQKERNQTTPQGCFVNLLYYWTVPIPLVLDKS